jgi:hypothetical protein
LVSYFHLFAAGNTDQCAGSIEKDVTGIENHGCSGWLHCNLQVEIQVQTHGETDRGCNYQCPDLAGDDTIEQQGIKDKNPPAWVFNNAGVFSGYGKYCSCRPVTTVNTGALTARRRRILYIS